MLASCPLNSTAHLKYPDTTGHQDGIQVAQNSSLTATASLSGTSPPFYVGIDGDGTSNAWNGFIDEVKVFDYAKSADQVKADYTAKGSVLGSSAVFGPVDAANTINQGLVGYWKLDESSGSAGDSSGNGTTLTNNNTTAYSTFGKFGNDGWFVSSLSNYFSTATTISNVNTVAFWASPSATTTNFINLASGVYINASSGTVSFTGAGSPSVYVNGVLGGTVTANSWNHIVAVSTTPITASAFEVGRANGSYANGHIDDVRLYSRQFTQSDVSRLYDWGPAPVGWWKFDERTGTSAFDSSGNGNTGTLTNGPQWTTGKFGQALSFDGSTNYVDMGNPGSGILDFGKSTDFTLSAWVKIPSGDINTRVISGKWCCGGTAGYILVFSNLTNGKLEALITDGTTTVTPAGATNINDGNWHHVAATFVRSGNVTFYVDGKNDGSANISTVGSITNTAGFEVGRRAGGSLDYFKGTIDDARVYNYALTPKQIVSVMNADHPSVGSPVGSPIGYWRFDEGYGTTAHNAGSAGSALDGTLTNFDSPATYGSGWTDKGKIGKALTFNGVGNKITVSNSGSIGITSDITISAWINIADTSCENPVIDRHLNTSKFDYDLYFGGTTQMHFFSDALTPSGVTSSSISNLVNTWHYVSVTRSGGTVTFYLDGTQLGSTVSMTGTMNNTANSTVSMGCEGTACTTCSTDGFKGKEDEVRIYNYALSADEVKVDYNQGKAQVLGSLSTQSDNITASNSAAQAYCPPGDSATCNPPVVHLPFDERTGTTANDITGNANTGTLATGATWSSGKLGGAVNFQSVDATSADGGGSVAVTQSSSINNLNTLTISAWVYVTRNISNPGYIIQKASGFALDEEGGNFCFYASRWATTQGIWCNSFDKLNTWYHIVVTYDYGSTSNNPIVYINGVQDTTFTCGANCPAGSRNSETGQLTVGNISTNTRPFNGIIDDVRVYNYIRTPAQVEWDYNKGGPVGWWKLDECTGSTVYDASGNSNNGTITIGASGTQTSAGNCTTVNTATAWYNGRNGKFNASLNFDGTDDYVNAGNVTQMNGVSQLSYSVWFKKNVANAYMGVSKKCTGIEDYGDGNYYFYIGNNSGCVNYGYIPSPQDTNWHHIVTVYDGTQTGNANRLKAYVDNIQQTLSFAGTIPATTDNTTDSFCIGTETNGSTCAFKFTNGQIDDVRVYNYPLTQAQIRTLYNENAAVRFGPLSGQP